MKQYFISPLIAVWLLLGLCRPLYGQYNVTFQVDMNQQVVSPNGVHIAGDFQTSAGYPMDWDPSTAQMTDANADGIYEITVMLPVGTYAYKFINDNTWTWGGDEGTIPAPCGVNGNRSVTLSSSTVLPVVCFNLCTTCPAHEVRYVNSAATGLNTGTSWADAFTDLQSALAVALPGDSIWVAGGVYKPSTTDDRNASFVIPNGVRLFGSFTGSETSFSQRVIPATGPTTVLTGDLIGDDTANFGNNAENSYHVVRYNGGADPAELSGVVITGGNANGTFPDDSGAGMFNNGSSGGNTPLILEHCVFARNYGGALYNYGNSGNASPTVKFCVFEENVSAFYGGAMMNNGYYGNSSPLIANCIFKGNSASNGGAIFNASVGGNTTPFIINCLFFSNNAVAGGAIHNDGRWGGNSNPIVTSSTMVNNYASLWGHAISNDDMSGTANPQISNCIIWGSASSLIYGGIPTVSYSLIEGGFAGTGNIAINPSFANASNPIGADNVWGTADDGFLPNPCSPAINAGDNNAAPGNDLTGSSRIFGGIVDIGAYETSYPTVYSPITLVATPGAIACAGGAAPLTIQAAGGSGSAYWYQVDGSPAQASHVFPSVNAGTHTITVSDSGNCNTTETISIAEPADLLLDVVPNPSAVCSGDTTWLACFATGGTPGYSYLVDGLVTANGTLPVVADSSVWVLATATDNNGCKTTDSVYVTVFPLPATPVITANGSTLSVPAGYNSYQWYVGGAIFSNAVTASIFAPTPGNYTVCVTNAVGCENCSAPYGYLVSTDPTVASLHLHPNPTTGLLHLRTDRAQTGEILDATGRVLAQIQVLQGDNTLNITHLPVGVYLLRLESGEAIRVVKE